MTFAKRTDAPNWLTKRARRHSPLAAAIVILTTVVATATVAGVTVSPAEASVRAPFGSVFSTEDNGAIVLTGNSQLTCPTAASGCSTARTSNPSTTAANSTSNNNSFTMQFLDNDSLATTTNSTSADLALPAGSTVLYARLVWGGRQTAGSNGAAATGTIGQVKFRAPNAAAYTTLTATTTIAPNITGTDALPYQASIDVTSRVLAAGNGTYWIGDIRAATGEDRYAGWSLIVAYRNPSLPLRDLSIFEGFADVTTSAGNSSVSIPVTGFLTPAIGAVNASVGFVAWEGDRGSIGDTLALGATPLSDASRPTNNFFDSGISDGGANVTTRSPNTANTFGVDVGRLSANGILANGSTSTTINVATNQEFFYPGIVTTQIDLFTPAFNAVSKTAVNLSGNDPAKVGDTIEYGISFTNTGQDFADQTVVSDVLAPGQTIVPGSILVTQSPAGVNNGSKTDATGDDIGEYIATSRTVRVRVGTGANSTTGGTLAPAATISLRFRATVDKAAAGTTLLNTPSLSYRARTIARDYIFVGNTVAIPVQAIADLSLTKASVPVSPNAGTAVQYVLTATNNGPNPATDVAVVDTLPAGITYTGFTAPGGVTCSAAGQIVTCAVGTVANAATVAITLNTTVGSGVPASTLVNQATVSSSTADDAIGNNLATATTVVTTSADLVTSKSIQSASTATAGATVTYAVSVTNSGPSDAASVAITDPVPAGAVFVSATSTIGTCGSGSGSVTCSVGTLGAGQTATATIVVRLGTGFIASTIINTASAASTTADPQPANNTASVSQGVVATSDVSITKVAAPTTTTAGSAVTYTLTASNAGPSDAAAVVIADPAVAGLIVQSASSSRGTCTVTSGSVSCQVGTLNPGANAVVTVLAVIAPTRPGGPLLNSASVTTSTAQSDTTNDTANATVQVTTSADLAISKTGPGNFVGGTQGTYTLEVSNSGPSQATGVAITDTLPAGFTFVSSPDGCSAAGQTVSCPVGTVTVGAVTTRSIVVQAPGVVTGAVVNNASVTATTSDPVGGNNTASFTSIATNSADIRITKATSPTAPVAGTSITYTMVVTNGGPSIAEGVAVTDVLPTGIHFVSATIDGTPGCTAAGQTVTCGLDTLNAAATRTIVVTATVDSTFIPGPTSNTASVSSVTPPDPTSSNNSATSNATIVASADLAVTLSTVPGPVTAGTTITYSLTVNNFGPSMARNTIVTGQVPDGLTPQLGSSGGACVLVGKTVTCSLGNLPAGATLTIPLLATINPDYPAGPLSGQALIGSNTPDPVAANNASTSTVSVVTSADLRTTKVVDATPLVAGGEAAYTITATNAGPSDAVSIQVTDTLDSALTPIAATSTVGSCSTVGQTVTCLAARLPSGSAMIVTVRVRVASSASGAVTNSATSSSTTPDPDLGQNTASITTPVAQTAALIVNKSVTPQPVRAGAAVTYVVTVTNTGPSDAATTTLTDVLPAGLTVLTGGVSTTAGTCTTNAASTDVGCTFGTLAVGSSRTVSIAALIPATTADGTTITNTAVAASPTSSQPPAARSGSATSTVVTEADLAVVKQPVDSPDAGAPHSYTISVTNNGPSVARGVVTTDALPTGTTLLAASTSIGACAESAGTLSCELGDMVRGEIATIQLTVQVSAGLGGQTLTNTATVASQPATGTPTTDPNGADNSSTTTEVVGTRADIILTKTITSGPITAGATVTYQLAATNIGPSDTTALFISDPVPAGTTFVAVSGSDAATCQNASGVVSCQWAAVSLGATRTMTLSVSVPAATPAGQIVANTATAGSAAVDPTPTSATATGPVVTSADLAVTKSLLSGTPIAGGIVRWQVIIANLGPSNASAVTLTDAAPSGVTFTTATTTVGGCTPTPAQIDCAIGGLLAGATAAVTIVGTLDPAYAGSTLGNTATAASTTPDLDPSNNSNTITTAITSRADLSVTKTATATNFVAGEGASWIVMVNNAGPSTATDVVVTDAIPAGIVAVSASINGGPACTVNGAAISCPIGAVTPGLPATIRIDGTVSAEYSAAAVVNSASATSATPDPDPLNNTGAATSTVSATADLAVTKTGPADASPGGVVTWQVTVVNAGPSVARAVTLTDTLPAGLINPQVSFGGASCPIAGGQALCQLGSLPVSDGTPATAAAVTITARIDPAATETAIINTATVASATTDPVPENNSSAATTQLDPLADLEISKVADAATFVPGEPVSWTITVDNDGPSVARSVTVGDLVPASVTITSASILTASGPVSCPVVGQQITCAVGDVVPAAPVRVAVVGRLAQDYAIDELTNVAVVSSATDDPTTGDQTAQSITDVVAAADLSIGKDVVGLPIAGGPIEFSITVRNDGPSAARAVEVVDDLPIGIDLNEPITLSDPRCGIIGAQVRCALGDLDDDDVVTFSIEATLSILATDVANTATVASPTTADPDPTDNASTATAVSDQVADVAVTITGPTTVIAGETISWTVTVSNNGPSIAANVALSGIAPPGVDLLTVTASGQPDVVCTSAAPAGCTIASLEPGISRIIVVSARVLSSYAAPTIVNSASVTSSTSDSVGSNNVASATTVIARFAALVVDKTVDPAVLVPGLDATYTITVHNDGPSDADGSLAQDPLPAGLVPRGAASSSQGSCPYVGATMRCTLGVIAAGATVTILVPVSVDPSTTATAIVNVATASSTTPAPAGTPAPSASTSTAVTPLADLSLTKTAPAVVVAGEPLRWTLLVANAGPSVAGDVVITDTLPPGTGPVSIVTTQGSCSRVGDDVTCNLGSLAVGVSSMVTIDLRDNVPAGATLGLIVNRATVASTAGEPDPTLPDGRSDDATTDIVAEADLFIAKSAVNTVAVPGQTVAWDIVVGNNGPSNAIGVEVTDLLAASLGSVTITAPDGVECDPAGSCTIATLPPGNTSAVTIRVSATLDSAYAASTLVNTATTSSDTFELNGGNNTASATMAVAASADLHLVKTAAPSTMVRGSTVTWTLTVTNDGPSVARSVVLTDVVPSGFSAVIVDAPPSMCTAVVVCTIGDLAPMAAPIVITISATLDPDYGGSTVANLASLASPTPDSDTADNSAATNNAVASVADLVVTKTGPVEAVAGGPISWTVRVTNNGPSVATDVVMADLLPPGVINGALDPDQGMCVALQCDLGSLLVGGDAEIVVTGEIDPAFAAASILNSASATSAAGDPSPSDNTATATTPVRRSANVSVVKSVDVTPLVPGESALFTLDVHNDGPSTAVMVVVTDQVPVGLEIGAVSTSSGSCDPVVDQLVRCTLATLADGDSAQIRIPVDVPADYGVTTYSNTASAIGATPDPDLDDNVSQIGGTAAPSADLGIDVVPDRSSVLPGDALTWVLPIVNTGSSDAADVIVTITLPAGVATTSVIATNGGVCDAVVGVTLVCRWAVVSAGAPPSITVVATVNQNSGLLVTSATIASAASDPDLSNNAATASTPIAATADLLLTKVVSSGATVAGSDITWQIVVENTGPSPAIAVRVDDTLPNGVLNNAASPVIVTPSQGSCIVVTGAAGLGGVVACELGDLAPGAHAVVDLTATVDPSMRGPLTNAAVAATATVELDTTNNGGVVSSTVIGSADLSVTKVVSRAAATVGETVTFTITATNRGPSTSDDVRVAESLPAGLSFVAAVADTGTFDPSSGVWSIGTMGPADEVRLVIDARITGTGSLANSVTITGSNASGSTSDDSASASVIGQAVVQPPAPPPPTPVEPPPGPPLPATGSDPMPILALALMTLVLGLSLCAVGRVVTTSRRTSRRSQPASPAT